MPIVSSGVHLNYDITRLLPSNLHKTGVRSPWHGITRIDWRRDKAKDSLEAALKPLHPASPKSVTTLDPERVSISALPTGAGRFIGRDIELSRLNAAWAGAAPGAPAANKTNVALLHAIGGAGKTALMRKFIDDLAANGFAGAARVYGWSAYSQGSGEDKNVDADSFLNDALRFFGHDLDKEPLASPLDKGRALARLVGAERNLLILDGLEPLQAPPHVNGGYLKDKGVAALIKELAASNRGLVVITSRQELPELDGKVGVDSRALAEFDDKAGAERSIGYVRIGRVEPTGFRPLQGFGILQLRVTSRHRHVAR